MSETLLEKTTRMIEGLKEGKFVEGMEEFYADHAINEEATGAKIEGKAHIIANEKNTLANVKAYHGIDIKALAGGPDDGKGNGVTFAEYKLSVEMKDGSTFNPDQVQVTHWRDGQADHIKFYYDPSKL